MRSLEHIATKNLEFNQKIIANLPLCGDEGYNRYKKIYNDTNAKTTDLLWLVTHQNVEFSIPFSLISSNN